MDYEVLIVGGGVAGLSGALLLARCGRRIVVCDDGRPRNAVSHGVHGFLTRDGTPPQEFLRLGREQLRAYPSVSWRTGEVVDVQRLPGGFRLLCKDGSSVTGAKLLLATGLVDELPEIPGVRRFWGHSVFICPLCDGWEVRGKPCFVFGRGRDLYEFALELRQWAGQLTVGTDGSGALSADQQAHLERLGCPVRTVPVVALEGTETQLQAVRFADGSHLEVPVMFLTTCQHQRSTLAEKLGCQLDPDGAVPARFCDAAAAEGVWVAGNASSGLQLAIIAAAEGARAAHAINECLVSDALRGT